MKYEVQFKQKLEAIQVVQAVVEVDDPADIPQHIDAREFLRYLVVGNPEVTVAFLPDEPIVMKVVNEDN